jgi:hypothetical protein
MKSTPSARIPASNAMLRYMPFMTTWTFYAGAFVVALGVYALYEVVRIAILSAYRHFTGQEQRSCL